MVKRITTNYLVIVGFLILTSGITHADNISVNFSKTTGVVDPYFYGVNTHGVAGNSYSWIDTNHDGTVDTLSNYTWHREVMLNASIGEMRADMYLELIAPYINASTDYRAFLNDTTTNTKNIEARRNLTQWAYQNNVKVLWVASYMPAWLADNASTCASNHNRCAPTSYTTWGNLVVNYLYAVGCYDYPGTCEVEAWNEPDLGTFLQPDGTCNDRVSTYIRLYNSTYDAIKASNMSSIKVGGPATSDSADNSFPTVCGWQVTRAWAMNETTSPPRYDFLSAHAYWSYSAGSSYDGRMLFVQNGLTQHLTAAGANQSTLRYLSEYNVYEPSVLSNNSSGYTYEMARMYTNLFNIYGNVTRAFVYQHSQSCAFGNYACYQEYPYQFTWVQEPLLGVDFSALYNLTKVFAVAHPPNSSIVNITRATNTRLFCTQKNSAQYCTIVNIGTATINANVSVVGLYPSRIYDYSTGTNYTVNSDSSFVVSIASHGVSNIALETTNTCGAVYLQPAGVIDRYGVARVAVNESCSLNGTQGVGGSYCTASGCVL